jgi:hypothetical protein
MDANGLARPFLFFARRRIREIGDRRTDVRVHCCSRSCLVHHRRSFASWQLIHCQLAEGRIASNRIRASSAYIPIDWREFIQLGRLIKNPRIYQLAQDQPCASPRAWSRQQLPNPRHSLRRGSTPAAVWSETDTPNAPRQRRSSSHLPLKSSPQPPSIACACSVPDNPRTSDRVPFKFCSRSGPGPDSSMLRCFLAPSI